MSTEELRDLARRLAGAPADPTLFERLLDAAAVTRCGLELLEQLAEELEGQMPPTRAALDPSQLAAFRPGDRLLDPEGEEARTGLLDVAAEQLRLSLGAGSSRDLQELLAVLTEGGLSRERLETLAGFLSQLPPDALERLRGAVADVPRQQESRSPLERVASAMLPHPEGKDGDLLVFAGDRMRDALSLIRTGREMLHELVALLPPIQGMPVEPASFVPGLPVHLSGIAVPTDPLELLHAEVGALLASTPDAFAEVESWLTSLIGSLDREGRPVGVLSNYLTEEALPELQVALGLPDDRETGEADALLLAPLPLQPSRRNRVNIGQLARALERAPARLPTIDAAWDVLSSPEQSFARRFAAGVVLCRKTRELVRDRPKEAAAWAARVGQAAEGLAFEGEEFPSRMAAFLATFAAAHVGNALRVEGHLRMADRFFLPFEEDDLLGLRAEYLGLKAALRQGERQYREALSLLEEADRVARRGGFPGALDTAARIRVTEARIFIMLGELDAAAAFLRSALGIPAPVIAEREVIPEGTLSPPVRWNVLQNLADCLSKAGSIDEAASLLPEVEALGLQIGLPETEGLRTAWIRARVRLSEDWTAAREMLGAVRTRFIELGFLFDAALASLELAVWHAEQLAMAREFEEVGNAAEHLQEIRKLASESARFFVGAEITPEAVAALALFQYVAAVSAPEPATIRKIERLFRQAASV